MNLVKMLVELREEANRLNEAINAIERIIRRGGKRRGRPPKWMLDPASKLAHEQNRSKQTSEE